jgi:hypothetical protein
MTTYNGAMSKYNGMIPTFEGKIVADYGIYIQDFANGYDLSTNALLYFPEINKVTFYDAYYDSYFIFSMSWNGKNNTVPPPNLNESESISYFIQHNREGFTCTPEEMYNFTSSNINLYEIDEIAPYTKMCSMAYNNWIKDKTIVMDKFVGCDKIDFNSNEQYWYCHSYLMNQIYNDWYNNYYLLNKTSSWNLFWEANVWRITWFP